MIKPSFQVLLGILLFQGGFPLAWSQTVEQRAERQRLKEQVIAKKAVRTERATEQLEVRDALIQQREELQRQLEELKQRKRELDGLIEEQQTQIAQQLAPILSRPEDPYDTVVFTSGRVISCSVASFEAGRFALEDAEGNSLYVTASAIQSVLLRTKKEAVIFPPHVLHQQAVRRSPVRKRPETTPPPDMSMTGHPVDLKTIWRRPDNPGDNGIGASDSPHWELQYVLTIDPLGLFEDGEQIRARIWVFSEDVENSGNVKLLLHADETFTPTLLQMAEIKTNPMVLTAEEVGEHSLGFNHFRYVIELSGSNGDTVNTTSNSKQLLQNLENIKNMSIRDSLPL